MFELIYCVRSLAEGAAGRFAEEFGCEAIVNESALIEDSYWLETRLNSARVLQSCDGMVSEISPVGAFIDVDMLIDGDDSFDFTIPEVGVSIEPGDRLVVRFVQDFGDSEGALANSLLTGIAEVWKLRS